MLLTILHVLAATGVAFAAQQQLVKVTNFGPNPTGVGMYVYKPSRLANPPPLLVAMHYCGGSGPGYFSYSKYADKADQYGFIVIYPDAPRSPQCFDVASSATLTHDAGGDSQGIASMVKYAISNYGVDASRVFASGTSSGGMMTNVMIGSYPELFAAASSYSGVPFACFPTKTETGCVQGNVATVAASKWGDLVRGAEPGYSGRRPKMTVWHGTTDTVVNYVNYDEQIKQWTNVFGISATATSTSNNNPQSNYIKRVYGNGEVIGYTATGVGHVVPLHEDIELAWYGITGQTNTQTSGPTSSGPSSSTPGSTWTPPPTTTSSSPRAGQTLYGQCGGQNWTGPTTCSQGTCKYSNPWYSQCLN